MYRYQTVALLLLVSFAVIATGISLLLASFVSAETAEVQPDLAALTLVRPPPCSGPPPRATYLPPTPPEAPAGIRAAVLSGHSLFVTSKTGGGGGGGQGGAPGGETGFENVQSGLQCENCHFHGGITEGGKNGSISLVGAAASYPKKHHGRVMTLPDRINSCLTDSLNASPLPLGSSRMTDLVAYLEWISRDVPVYSEVPWLGLPKLSSKHEPDAAQGRELFEERCSPCHGKDGGGKPMAPPVWGNKSFTKKSGFHRVPTLASFIFYNMPRQNPDLSQDQALNAAAFLASQPRP